MKSMELSADEAKEYGGCCIEGSDDDGPKYPWGLEISLNDGSLKKLDMKKMPEIGSKVVIQAVATVTSLSQRQERDGDSNSSVSLQITDMELASAKSNDDRAKTLFPDMD